MLYQDGECGLQRKRWSRVYELLIAWLHIGIQTDPTSFGRAEDHSGGGLVLDSGYSESKLESIKFTRCSAGAGGGGLFADTRGSLDLKNVSAISCSNAHGAAASFGGDTSVEWIGGIIERNVVRGDCV